MAWRLLPNRHGGDCAYRSAAQLLGWEGDQYENMMRLRRECAADVRKMSIEQLTFAAYTYQAAYDESATRHEVRWMAPFAGLELSDELVDGRFREALARAIETPGNLFWGDHFTLELISNRYKFLFLTVRDSTNNITIMPSRFSESFRVNNYGELGAARVGFLLAQGTTAFDAICYASARGDCIASITRKDLDENNELADIVYSVLARPKPDVRFPVTVAQLISQSRFMGREEASPPRYEPARPVTPQMEDLLSRVSALRVSPVEPKAKVVFKESETKADVKHVRNPETKRCIIVGGPTWRKHQQMYGDRVYSYEVC